MNSVKRDTVCSEPNQCCIDQSCESIIRPNYSIYAGVITIYCLTYDIIDRNSHASLAFIQTNTLKFIFTEK